MLERISRAATYYYHPDHLGSVSVVSNHKGEPYERVEYLPFGEIWIEDTDPATSYIPFRFTSKELDEETGLYYYGARYYEPKMSRWMSADPAGFALINPNRGGYSVKGRYSVIEATNWYSYVSNNPVRYVDPTGMYDWEDYDTGLPKENNSSSSHSSPSGGSSSGSSSSSSSSSGDSRRFPTAPQMADEIIRSRILAQRMTRGNPKDMGKGLGILRGKLSWPTRGRVTSEFGEPRTYPSGKEGEHKGIDIAAVAGTPIRAAAGGVVSKVSYDDSYGHSVEVDHGNGIRTRYAHMKSKPSVAVGQEMSRGGYLGAVGSTGNSSGNHLHFEVHVSKEARDPRYFLRGEP